MVTNKRLQAAVRAFAVHFALSLIVASGIALLIFGVWFKYPYRDLAGGQRLFWLLVGIDVICGPLLTAVLFNPLKSRKELIFDLTLVALLQCAALAYGLHSISLARPVRIAFETDRFVSVSVADIATERLDEAPVELRRLPYAGPILVGTRMPKDGDEVLSSIESSIQGVEPSARPGWWQDYELSRDTVRGRMKKISALESKVNSDEKTQLFEAVKNTGLSKDQLYYLPLVSKKSLDDWVVLLNERADIVGYAPVGGFR